MMDIFFQEPSLVPLPPDEVRIQKVSFRPYPDRRRVRVHIEIAPFQKRPSLEVVILDENNEQVAQTRVIETMGRVLEMTLHLRASQPGGVYTVQTSLYYQEEPETGEGDQSSDYPLIQIVDQRQDSFTLTGTGGSNPVTGDV